MKWGIIMIIRYNETLDSGVNSLRLELLLSGYVMTGPEWHGVDLCAPFSRFYIVDEGEAILECGEQKVVMEPGNAYLIPTGCHLSFSCPEKLSKLYFHLCLRKEDGYDLLQQMGEIGVLKLPDGWMDALKKHQSSRTLSDALLLKQYLYQIIGMFTEKYAIGQETITSFSAHVAKSLAYIRKNLSARLNIAELAAHCFVSRRHLTDLFRRELGVTPGKYIDDQLTIAAQRRLIQTEDSVGKISEELGFCDQFYFCRKFKQAVGLTPIQYRDKNRDQTK